MDFEYGDGSNDIVMLIKEVNFHAMEFNYGNTPIFPDLFIVSQLTDDNIRLAMESWDIMKYYPHIHNTVAGYVMNDEY